MSKATVDKARGGHSPGRRDVLKSLAAGTAAAALAPRALFGGAGAAERPDRVVRGGMGYRRLGRTGLEISEIALGGSPLPDEPLLRALVDRGINYIDTSDSYENGNCERKVGRLFKAVGRDKIFIHARFHLQGAWTTERIIASVEGSLRRLATDHADVLGIHGVENADHVTDERILAAFDKLKSQGKLRFRGLTCHVNQQEVVPRAVASGLYDMVQIGYNVFDIAETEKDVRTYGDYLGESGLRRLIDLCRAEDVGVTAMKVLKVGGRRQDLAAFAKAGASPYQAMIRWALENEKLAAVVIEILNTRQMEEDLAAAGRPLSSEEERLLRAHVAANARDYCHQCGLCQAACPAGIETASIARYLAYAESYGKSARALAGLREIMGSSAAAPACRDCGACERACPYGLAVRRRTRRAAALLA